MAAVFPQRNRITSYNVCYTKLLRLPAGVLNVVNGDKEAVDALLTDADVGAISFVGSAPVGEYVYKTGCAHGKRVQALTGAKNHMVVMPDADMDQTVDAVMGAAYGSAGERCMAISVVVTVGDQTANEFVITSYSIHYTKLYDVAVDAIARPLANCGNA